MALAPFLDMLNHKPEARIEAGFNLDSKCYEIKTYDSYRRGDQVYINYGAHSDFTLCLLYGFLAFNLDPKTSLDSPMPSFNPNDFMRFSIDDLIHSRVEAFTQTYPSKERLQKDLKCRIAELQRWNIFSGLGIDPHGLTWSGKNTLLVMCLDYEDFHIWKCKGPHGGVQHLSKYHDLILKTISNLKSFKLGVLDMSDYIHELDKVHLETREQYSYLWTPQGHIDTEAIPTLSKQQCHQYNQESIQPKQPLEIFPHHAASFCQQMGIQLKIREVQLFSNAIKGLDALFNDRS